MEMKKKWKGEKILIWKEKIIVRWYMYCVVRYTLIDFCCVEKHTVPTGSIGYFNRILATTTPASTWNCPYYDMIIITNPWFWMRMGQGPGRTLGPIIATARESRRGGGGGGGKKRSWKGLWIGLITLLYPHVTHRITL